MMNEEYHAENGDEDVEYIHDDENACRIGDNEMMDEEFDAENADDDSEYTYHDDDDQRHEGEHTQFPSNNIVASTLENTIVDLVQEKPDLLDLCCPDGPLRVIFDFLDTVSLVRMGGAGNSSLRECCYGRLKELVKSTNKHLLADGEENINLYDPRLLLLRHAFASKYAKKMQEQDYEHNQSQYEASDRERTEDNRFCGCKHYPDLHAHALCNSSKNDFFFRLEILVEKLVEKPRLSPSPPDLESLNKEFLWEGFQSVNINSVNTQDWKKLPFQINCSSVTDAMRELLQSDNICLLVTVLAFGKSMNEPKVDFQQPRLVLSTIADRNYFRRNDDQFEYSRAVQSHSPANHGATTVFGNCVISFPMDNTLRLDLSLCTNAY